MWFYHNILHFVISKFFFYLKGITFVFDIIYFINIYVFLFILIYQTISIIIDIPWSAGYIFLKLVLGVFFNQGRKTTLHRRIFVFKPVCFLKKNSEKMIIVTYHIVNVGHSPPPKLKVCVGGWVGDYYVIYYRIQVDKVT